MATIKIPRKQSDAWFLHYIMNNPALAERSKETYARRYTMMQRDVMPGKTFHYMLQHPDETVTAIKNHKNMKTGEELSHCTKDQYVTALLSFFEHAPEYKFANHDLHQQWKKLHGEIRQPIDLRYKTGEPTERQKESFVTWEDVIKKRDSLEPGTQERLLLSMYSYIPPVRNDYAQTRIFKRTPRDKNAAGNYVVFNASNPVVVLQEYKTCKRYNEIATPIPRLLYNEIKASLEKLPREYLFISPMTGEMYNNENTFSKWANGTLQNIFDRPVTLTTLRHSFLSQEEMQSKLRESTVLERENVSRAMGHSVSMQEGYIWRNTGGMNADALMAGGQLMPKE
jgi:integrase